MIFPLPGYFGVDDPQSAVLHFFLRYPSRISQATLFPLFKVTPVGTEFVSILTCREKDLLQIKIERPDR